jgi:tyrosine-protein kinase Etk/Wzc
MDPTPHANGTRPEEEIHLRDVWNLLVRNWWVILGSLVLVVGGTLAWTLYQVPVYEAVTSIRIEEDRSELPVLDVLQDLSGGSEVETEMEVLRSRTLAEQVVDSLALQVRVGSPRGVARAVLLEDVYVERWAPEGIYTLRRGEGGVFQAYADELGTELGPVSTTTPAALPGVTFTLTHAADEHDEIVVYVAQFDRAVSRLRESVAVGRPNREASIVTVRYESADTQLVHRVPNSLASRFIARGQDIRKTEATSTVAFLEEQIDTLARQLAAAEEDLTTFRETEQVVSISAEAESQVTQLSRLQAERNTIEAERQALQQLVDQIEAEAATADPAAPSPYVKLISFPSLLRSQAVSELLRTLNEANAQRSELLQRRTMEDPDVVNLTQRINDVETQLRNTALTYLQGLTEQVASYDQTLARFATELERIPAKEVQLVRLERRTDVLNEVYTVLQNRLQEARILEAVEDATVRVVDPAILPAEPIKPRELLNLLLGLAAGGLLGVGIAFTREYLDDTVHTREDVQLATGVPVLGTIPRIRESANGKRGSPVPVVAGGEGGLAERLVAGRDPRNPVSEAYRSLRTNLTFSNPDDPPRTLVFTSPLPQDGKSTSAANLSITLAQQGTKTILIDADLRRGVLHTVFGTEREPGLTDVLTGKCALEDAVQEVDLGASGSLWFLPSGPYPPNPAEMLGSQRMRELLEELDRTFEITVLDSAPLTVVTDAAVLGTTADGVVLVARANQTEKGSLSYAKEQLAAVRAPVLGAVLNDVDFRRDARYYSGYGKYGYYYHYYYADNEKRREREERRAARERGVRG